MPLLIVQPISVIPALRGASSLQICHMHSAYFNECVLRYRNSLPNVSYIRKSEFLKFSGYDDLGFINHLKVLGNLSKLSSTYRVFPQTSNHGSSLVIKNDYPQNTDLPKYYSRKEKKPFPVPIVELRRAARERLKNSRGQPRRPVPPPKNGLLVKRLIPVAYDVFNARILLINNLRKLLKVVPVHACKCCNEIHIGPIPHPFKTCRGPRSSSRYGLHDWGSAVIDDILVEVDAYHLYDRLGKRIPHNERFSIPRIPAVMELCIQAGVDLPKYPAKRRRKAIIRTGKSEFIDADESDLPDPEPENPKIQILSEIPESEVVPPSEDEIVSLAEETLEAWERMRQGANKLMKMYPVRVCGYCPEVHVGPSGHKAQNCGAHKHQQRNGQHGWQRAVIDDLIPPRYVWHVPDVKNPTLKSELRTFYGQAPAIVELCAQAGAEVPEQYTSTMRLDIGIPASIEEAEKVV